MARTPLKKIVQGHEYEITPWDGLYALRMTQRIAKALKDSGASEGISEIFSGGLDAEVSPGVVTEAIVSVLSYGDTPQLLRDMLHGTSRDGRDISMDSVFNEAYTGNIGELVQALPGIVEANFGDFFGMAGAIGVREGADSSKADSPAN